MKIHPNLYTVILDYRFDRTLRFFPDYVPPISSEQTEKLYDLLTSVDRTKNTLAVWINFDSFEIEYAKRKDFDYLVKIIETECSEIACDLFNDPIFEYSIFESSSKETPITVFNRIGKLSFENNNVSDLRLFLQTEVAMRALT